MKLTSISEHSDWLEKNINRSTPKWNLHRLRVAFGKQLLNISFFVPAKFVDGEWVVLEHPKAMDYEPVDIWNKTFENDVKEYETAKSNVLFEGFEVEEQTESIIWFSIKNFNLDSSDFSIQYSKKTMSFHYSFNKYKTIEDLVKYDLTLTTTAKKQIGL